MTSAATLSRLPTAISADVNGNVGIGTSSTVGNSGNILAVYGTTRQVGNIVLSNLASGTSGIYFADGTFQSTAGGGGSGTGNYSNTNVASYLSGPVLVGNLYVGNTTASTSTTTGSLITNGGAGIGGNLNVAGNIVTAGTSGNITGVNDLSTVTVTTTGNVRINTLGTGIRFPDNSLLTTANTSFGLPGTIQYAGVGNTSAGNSGALFWDTSNNRLGVGTAQPNSIFNVNGTNVPLFQTSNSLIGSNNFEILVGNSSVHGITVGYVNNTLVPYGYLQSGSSTRTVTIGATGRVGIGGVTAPQNLFEVSGNVVIGSTWAGNTNFINPPVNGIAVQGRVGVGTYTPLSTLDVNGIISARTALSTAGTATVNALSSNGSVTGTAFIPTGAAAPTDGMFLPATNTVGFATNSTERMRISSVGDVGIGTSIPNSYTGYRTLSVGGSGADGAIDANFSNGRYGIDIYAYKSPSSAADDQTEISAANSANEPTWSIGYAGENTTYGAYFNAIKAQPLTFWTNNLEKMRITSTGNVGINTTGSITTGYRLDVGGSVRVAGGLVATGEVTAYFSDARLKANITAITNAVDKVMAINGVYYNANDLAVEIAGEDKTIQRVGLLAQEVEAILPHVVKAAPFDIGDNGISRSGEHYKTLQYERLVPLLVEAIKEQQKTIDDLILRVAKLEGIRTDG